MRVLREKIIERRVRAELAKAAGEEERFDMRDQLCADAAAACRRRDPDAFEESDRLAVAAIGVRPDRNLGKPDRAGISILGDEAPRIAAPEHRIDTMRMRLGILFRPE